MAGGPRLLELLAPLVELPTQLLDRFATSPALLLDLALEPLAAPLQLLALRLQCGQPLPAPLQLLGQPAGLAIGRLELRLQTVALLAALPELALQGLSPAGLLGELPFQLGAPAVGLFQLFSGRRQALLGGRQLALQSGPSLVGLAQLPGEAMAGLATLRQLHFEGRHPAAGVVGDAGQLRDAGPARVHLGAQLLETLLESAPPVVGLGQALLELHRSPLVTLAAATLLGEGLLQPRVGGLRLSLPKQLSAPGRARREPGAERRPDRRREDSQHQHRRFESASHHEVARTQAVVRPSSEMPI